MSIFEYNFVRDFIRVCEDGFRMGWHEYSGGNLSYRLTQEDIRLVKDSFLSELERRDIGRDIPGLGDEYFLVTGYNKHFRDVSKYPELNIGIIKLDEDGEDYSVCYGHEGFLPPAGLAAHLIGHDIKKHTQNHRVIYHTHPQNILALTYILPLESSAFSRALWQMMPDAAVVFPNGVKVIEWMPPGSVKLAEMTGTALKYTDAVVWAHHGLFVSGIDYASTFALAHTIEKAAEITVKVIQMGGKKQGITRKDLKALAKAYNLNIKV